MRTFFVAFFLLAVQLATAQQLMYSSLSIPDSLKKGADAVYQLEEMSYDIKSPSSMEMKLHTIVTILNKQGLRHSYISIPVSKFYKLDEVEVKVYNDIGLPVSRYRKKDFSLEGMIQFDYGTLASDDNIYLLNIPVPNTPCTIETEYTVYSSGYIDIPGWQFGSSSTSVMTSRFILKTAPGTDIRYKMYNFKTEPLITEEGRSKKFTWEVKNRPIPYKESNIYGSSVYMPWIDISPMQFNYDGYPGSLESWKEFGKWTFPFYQEEKPFAPEKVEFFKKLVEKYNTPKEKIAVLYNYLQNETRYVSIQYGIGGFKPFSCSFTEKKKYGDCKALTHYMKNILQAVGIKAIPALINAGKNEAPVDPLFASNRFNHVILCVPLEKDSMWLECTAKQNYPGFLSNFTENRNALLLTENGGVLVKTPASNAVNNQWNAKTNFILYDDGSAISTTRLYVSGEFWDPFYAAFSGGEKDDLKKLLINGLGFKIPDDYEVKLLGDSAQGHTIQIRLSLSQLFDFKSGSKHFFPLRHYKLNEEDIKPAEKRQYDYLFDFPYIKTDTTVYQLPGNFKKESLPAATKINTEFFTYSNDVLYDEATLQLKVATKLTLEKHIVKPAKYNEVANGFESIRKDENQKIVLRKE